MGAVFLSFLFNKMQIILEFFFVPVSDLPEHPAAVPQGAVWVQVHADRPQLVQLLLWPPNTQGECVCGPNAAVTMVTAAMIYNADIVDRIT